MEAKEFLRFPISFVDSVLLYPLQQYVVRKCVEGLQSLDDAIGEVQFGDE